jgi:tRNA pseudouridine38-40 synthase
MTAAALPAGSCSQAAAPSRANWKRHCAADRRLPPSSSRPDVPTRCTRHGQVAGVTVPRKWTAEELQRALNAVLPRDIWVAAAAPASDTFHARYDAVARGYAYRVGTAPISRSPFRRRWCWPLGYALAVERLNDAAVRGSRGRTRSERLRRRASRSEASGALCMCRSGGSTASAVLVFHVVANRFLHHMVRYMVGTMVDVARGRRAAGTSTGCWRAMRR